MMSKASNSSNPVAKARQVDAVTPPPGFCYVEESIARCSRATRQNVSFLRSSSVGSLVNVSGDEMNSSIENFANENAILVVSHLYLYHIIVHRHHEQLIVVLRTIIHLQHLFS